MYKKVVNGLNAYCVNNSSNSVICMIVDYSLNSKNISRLYDNVMFFAKFHSFPVRRVRRLRCNFAENMHVLPNVIYFTFHLNLMLS